MTPERERLLAQWEAAVKRKRVARMECVDAERDCEVAERALAAYDAAHKEAK